MKKRIFSTKVGFTHGAAVYLHRFTLETRPLLVGADVAAVGAVHAGEEHAELGCVDVVAFVVDNFVAVWFVFRCFYHTGPYRCSLFVERRTVFAFNIGHEGLPVKERTVAILFAVEIAAQGKDIFGRVLIHRRVGRRTYDDECVRGVADEDDQYRYQYHVEQSHGQLFLVEKKYGQCRRDKNADIDFYC